jgi:hypothetical protein
MERPILNSILTKYGVGGAAELSDERAEQKLSNRVKKGEFPPELTAEEVAALSGAGIEVPPDYVAGGGSPESPESPVGDLLATDPNAKRRYGLRAEDGTWEKIDEITDAKAEFRTGKRSDGRAWELVPDGEEVGVPERIDEPNINETGEELAGGGKDDQSADETGTESPAGSSRKAPARGEKGKTVSKTTTQKTTKTTSTSKALTPQKAAKAAADKKTSPTTKAAPAPKAGKTPTSSSNSPAKKAAAFGNADRKERKINNSQIFRDYFAEEGKVVKKEKVIEDLQKKGIKPATISSYVVWAKRKEHGTPDHANPWGFVLVEEKDDKGVKTLVRKGKTKGAPAEKKADKADKVEKPAAAVAAKATKSKKK